MRRVGRTDVACVLVVLALGACGEREPLPTACLEATPADVTAALAHAPGDVALQDGTRLSRCVARAIDDAELQVIGATLTAAASTLARRMAGDDGAALQLGFLIGATARGSAQTAGLQGDLADRIAGAGVGLDGPRQVELLRGRAMGRQRG
jgi:hypothetical protein